eukprot:405741-Pelagomonas_calceolata.AAC.2
MTVYASIEGIHAYRLSLTCEMYTVMHLPAAAFLVTASLPNKLTASVKAKKEPVTCVVMKSFEEGYIECPSTALKCSNVAPSGASAPPSRSCKTGIGNGLMVNLPDG